MIPKRNRLGVLFCTLFVLAAGQAFAQHEHGHDTQPAPQAGAIGEVDFRVGCAEEVRSDFDYALGMLHHMMYEAARNTFLEIAQKDPDCGMAWWGIAATRFQPIWPTRPGPEELEQGRQEIGKALGQVNPGREQLLAEATAAFYQQPEDTDYLTRLRSWHEALRQAGLETDDPDLAAFYGLSLLSMAQRTQDRSPLLDEAEEVLRGVHNRIPTHPGAIHYTIHATDVDGRAGNALDMVEIYGEIAPENPHALHMPSHIHVRLGNWPEVIRWNRRSAEAALQHPLDGAESHHYIHAADYLVYAWLQQGEDEKAEEVYRQVLARDRHQASFVSAFHFAALPARLAVEQRDWQRAAALELRTPGYLPWDVALWPEGLVWYARGLGAVYTGEAGQAMEAEKELAALRDRARAAGEENMAAYIETDRLVLSGRMAFEEGDPEKAVEQIRSAAELERTVEKDPVTPGALLPPNEALGDLLLDLGRPAEALEAYEASERIWPGRLNTLSGAAVAARLAGDWQASRKYMARLAGNGRADAGEWVELPALDRE